MVIVISKTYLNIGLMSKNVSTLRYDLFFLKKIVNPKIILKKMVVKFY
jgi:hypothetical protein